jgi:energy-coupling factor transport system substrate-specific component
MTMISRFTAVSAGAISLIMFAWPLFIQSETQASFAQACFMFLMPLLVALLTVEFSSGSIDSRQLAMLGVLSALNAVIRLLGAGVAGIETAFFLIIISAYVFGGSFGYILGASSILVSALISGGVGPWLPFQMMAAGLIGLGAGLITQRKYERTWLVGYAVIASFVYGGLMTLWNWPFLAGAGSSLSYRPGAAIIENLQAFLRYEIFTGGLLWDLGRAVTTVGLIALTGKTLLATLRRAANKVEFVPLD